MKMVNLTDIKGITRWFNADKIQKLEVEYDREKGKNETWIIFGEGLSSIRVYDSIPSVIREIKKQTQDPSLVTDARGVPIII